ncbi:RNA binding motif protein 6 [Phyllostomus discolor]|uniref:RNA binding motif protein 6 n=4 Tax=Phyllostomus discolor TaxID=89673 RepID=A0A6J2M5Z2_9CHIR|nr:RNA-binding protein 6 isoform X1 [Phyllostomus discolor]XP_035886201.1 RNA-binding protein 6 isoform X1 [Phyllostomus discolor]KAF6100873.1 RNA binding motif protein 6 [Phyllostomus discolor]
MWGDSRPANRTGPFRGSQEERFAPGWNRDYPPPPLKSHAQERHSGNFPGRDSLPFDFQGHSGPPFANIEEHSFSYGVRDGLHGDYRGGEGSGHDFRGGDFSSSDFQSRDSSQLDFRGRDIHSGDFRDREGPPMDYRGGNGTSMDYRGREASHMNYRDRDAHPVDFRGRDVPPPDFRGRGTYDLDFRGRDGSHTDFRGRDLSDLDFRTRDPPRSDFRNRDASDLDFRDKDGTQVDFRGRGSGTSDLDFRDRDAPHSDFRGRHRSRTDQDFRGRDVGTCMEFKGREMPSADPNILDYIQPSTQDREHSGMNVNKREKSAHDHAAERPAFGAQKGEFEHSDTREGETQGAAFEHESSSDFQNSQSPLPDQDKSQPSGGEKQGSDPGLFKEEGGLDFLGRQDTDYRSMEYRDVDHRLPGGSVFGYGQSKSFPEGRASRDAQQELQDQDYRTGPSEEKPSKLIRLSGVPENATKEEILNAFRTPDDMPVKDLQLKEYNAGYDYGYVCVEFSLLEDAIGCMEANQGTLMIRDKEVTLEYVPSPDFWYCKRCKASIGGHRSSCSFCKCPREVAESKQDLVSYPQPQKTPIPAPSEKPPSQAPKSTDKEPEPKKREEGQEPRLGHPKREAERYLPPRREGLSFRRDRDKEPWSGETRQDGESKTIMLKRIYRSTPPEVIVEVLEPYVHLTTANVRIIKNRTGPMGHTYGFIDLDSHAEALRVVKILQNLDPPFSIDGKMVAVNLATGKRRNDSGDHSDHMHYYQGKKYFRDRRGGGRNSDWSSDSNRQGQQSSSDCYIYDSATGYYYDPLAGTYYDPNTQQEVYVPQEPGSPEEEESKEKSSAGQKSSSKKETSKREGKEKKDRGAARFQENAGEGTAPLEDVFKKPLPPTVKKEESPPPPKVVNPLIGLLGEYGGDSDYEEDEEEEQPPPPQPRSAQQPQQRDESAAKKESEEDKLTDWNKLACLLCRRQFPNKEVLIKHQQLSDLHKQNLEIHRKIKQSEQELAYLERRERQGKFKERGNDRREKLQSFDSPERKRMKYSRDADSDRRPAGREGPDDGGKGGCAQQAAAWRKGAGLGSGHPGLASAEETEGRPRGPSAGAPGRPGKRQSNETYRDAVRRVMFARYKELD